jgi:hypothetical protein
MAKGLICCIDLQLPWGFLLEGSTRGLDVEGIRSGRTHGYREAN